VIPRTGIMSGLTRFSSEHVKNLQDPAMFGNIEYLYYKLKQREQQATTSN